MKRAALLALCLLGASTPAAAAIVPAPGKADPRIREVMFDPQEVVLLTGFVGYQLMVEFAPGERIENVAVGDALAWQVTPNRRANLLFVKPLNPFAATNMTVVTDLRRYAFELATGADGAEGANLAYVVRFRYPPSDETLPAPTLHASRNEDYEVKGPTSLAPASLFDDGRFTYFRWSERNAIPAIFVVGRDGAENLANYGVRDGYVVVEQTAGKFILRNGSETATVVNRALGGAR
ncbi:MAG: TrbG/VirB9 family P-type conjugative transfer protein [Phenylobacterium sp.]|uniref:TrbG/VirB9 family P-type conjugative transfer protein n=1 Tax=Phenylobacterium sp. TaxID=1871053 RepID=UPI0027333454|nr:TrbG/VirB9 family P-type conjugative transfer protein [Phenylobacterium sp.]MDP3749259.1 TrbG/VirB9 family P-type conjugative transfer protein [Phenylobacterium sp.]